FVLSPNDPFVFVDLDDPYAVDETGKAKHSDPQKIVELQNTVFQKFGNTYSELSPSGKGLHLISLGKLSGKGRRRHSVEMYDRARFMTMTGNAYTSAPISAQQDAIDWLYNE